MFTGTPVNMQKIDVANGIIGIEQCEDQYLLLYPQLLNWLISQYALNSLDILPE